MAKARVVLDSNVWISGVLWTGVPHRIIRLIEKNEAQAFATPSMLLNAVETFARLMDLAGYHWHWRSRMRKVLLVGMCWVALAGMAAAAEIHGTVSEGGKALPEGVPVKLDCSGTTASAQTDQFGSYSLKIAATGECTFSLDYKKSNPSLKVTVYDKPSRYDLVVTEAAGKLALTRK